MRLNSRNGIAAVALAVIAATSAIIAGQSVTGASTDTSNAPIVGIAATPDGNGYWEVASDGGIFAYGDANFLGSMGGQHLNSPIVGIAATADGGGYWEVAADGGIFAFGDAAFEGSMGGYHLNEPIVGIAPDPETGGYWEVASDGGIFAFNAPFEGSMGDKPLNDPVVGIAATPTGRGYWEVASDGGLFAFGTAQFYGSMGGQPLNQPIVGMSATSAGYWEVASDGGLFGFGNAQFYGSMGGQSLNAPVVGMDTGPNDGGYWEVAQDGGTFAFGDATFGGAPKAPVAPPATTKPVITYHAYVDPTFTQTTTNPLAVTYTYSAGASTLYDGVSVGLSALPTGILNFYNDGLLECSMNVGTEVTGGTCPVTYSTFGTHTVVTEYITNSTTSVSVTETEDIEPLATTTTITIQGGGPQGGLEFDVFVASDANRPVLVGVVTITISDTDQGWSYTESVGNGGDPSHPSAFSCVLVENYPSVGEYGGCGLSGLVRVVPEDGDNLVASATYGGALDWSSSKSTTVSYSMP